MQFSKFFATIIVVFALTALLFNQSISKYAEQKYHTAFALDSPLLIALNTPANALTSLIEKLLPNPAKLGFDTAESTLKSTPQEERHIRLENGKLVIKNSATFLLIGDSMMQGVSMTLTPQLKKQNLQVIDMAKQSTGLTYSKSFNWNETLENTLKENPNINIIVVMLGANDPWNIGRVRFGTQEWDNIYTERIQAIIEAAKAHNAFVFWYQVPLVKNKKLSEKIEHLNTLYQAQCDQEHALFIETNTIFAPNRKYLLEVENTKGNKVRIRANDGIHFSIHGSRLLSRLLLDKLEIIIKESYEPENAPIDSTNAPTKPTAKIPITDSPIKKPSIQSINKENPKEIAPSNTPLSTNDSPTRKYTSHFSSSAVVSHLLAQKTKDPKEFYE